MSNIFLALLVGFLVGAFYGLYAEQDATAKSCGLMHMFHIEETVYDCQVQK